MKQSIDYEKFRSANMTWGSYMYLYDWCKPKGYTPSDLNIGQMIEFLDEHNAAWDQCAFSDDVQNKRLKDKELCDELWSVIVKVCTNRKETA